MKESFAILFVVCFSLVDLYLLSSFIYFSSDFWFSFPLLLFVKLCEKNAIPPGFNTHKSNQEGTNTDESRVHQHCVAYLG